MVTISYITQDHSCWLLLKKIKIKATDICNFCQSESETIEHLFYECPLVNSLWKLLSDYLNNTCNLNISFSLIDVIFGKTNNSENLCMNLIILWTKQYIFLCSKTSELPFFSSLKSALTFKFKTEKYSWSRRNRIDQFNNYCNVVEKAFE